MLSAQSAARERRGDGCEEGGGVGWKEREQEGGTVCDTECEIEFVTECEIEFVGQCVTQSVT